jgi:hypothetical protein
MERKNWIKVLDNFLKTGKLLSEDYEAMDDLQKTIIQEIKKSIKRITYDKN